jgi:NAD(P)-dependent dehydrogenase (short-subunit alcohol dehydrogenase family)
MVLEQLRLTGRAAGVTGAGHGLGQQMALALAHAGAVNCIAMGWMDGDALVASAGDVGEQSVRFVPLKRPGKPLEVAPLCVYLASDASSYISGQVFFVYGGLTTNFVMNLDRESRLKTDD